MTTPAAARPQSSVRDALPLLALLGVNLLCALAVVHLVVFQAPNTEHLAAAQAFAQQHRILSTFLPVGYSGLLGVADLAFGQPGMTALTILLQLLLVAAAWAYARQCGLPVRAATTLAALLSLYPDLLLSYHKAWDTAITALLLFGFLIAMERMVVARGEDCEEVRSGLGNELSNELGKDFGDDLLLGVTLGGAILVRPNLALLVPLAAWLLWRSGGGRGTPRLASRLAPRLASRLALQFVLIAGVYLAGTTAVHGRPFLPRNGAYNFFAGTNAETRQFPLNMEDSIPCALRDLGYTVSQAAIDDQQSSALDPLYTRLAVRYIRAEPLGWAGLMAFKLKVLLLPDFKIHAPASPGGLLKIFAACALPVWLLASFARRPRTKAARRRRFVVAALIATYLLPFLLTISSPRFRVPLDFVLWIDAGIVLIDRRLAASA